MPYSQRLYIIETSLKIERNLSILLANMLFIQDIDMSKSLGNKSSSLAFNTKADILLDSKFISEIDRKKFQLFMEIRNQFAHNINCQTFLDCLIAVDGCETRLNNYYSVNFGKSKVDNIHIQIDALIEDINKIINNCHFSISEEMVEFVNAEIYRKAFEEMFKSLLNNIDNLDKLIDFNVDPENLKILRQKLLSQIVDTFDITFTKCQPEIKTKLKKRKLKQLE